MKSLIIAFAIAATTLAACNGGNNTTTATSKKKGNAEPVATVPVSEISAAQTAAGNTEGSMKEMVGQYLQIKNALANDNRKDAAAAGNAFVASMGKMEKTTLAAEKLKIWNDLSDDAKEMAEHIGMNGAKLDHQREHFDMLSKDMYDMVKAFGSGQVLYKDFCPMYNKNKGAIWLSETKEIKNPYYGKDMLTCGAVKETLQ